MKIQRKLLYMALQCVGNVCALKPAPEPVRDCQGLLFSYWIVTILGYRAARAGSLSRIGCGTDFLIDMRMQYHRSFCQPRAVLRAMRAMPGSSWRLGPMVEAVSNGGDAIVQINSVETSKLSVHSSYALAPKVATCTTHSSNIRVLPAPGAGLVIALIMPEVVARRHTQLLRIP